MKTQCEVRESFWHFYQEISPCICEIIPDNYYPGKQNILPANVRMAFVDYVDSLQRDGTISEELAASVTL